MFCIFTVTYWPVSLIMCAGQLLHVKSVGTNEDFWRDLRRVQFKPLGWCEENKKVLQPPQGMFSYVEDLKSFKN